MGRILVKRGIERSVIRAPKKLDVIGGIKDPVRLSAYGDRLLNAPMKKTEVFRIAGGRKSGLLEIVEGYPVKTFPANGNLQVGLTELNPLVPVLPHGFKH